MTRALSRSEFALALFRFLDERDIAYCVVGDSRGFPDSIQSDIDIVVAPGALPTLARDMLVYCSQNGLRLVQCLQHEHNARYFVLSWIDQNGMPDYVIPDIGADYYRNGKLFLPAQELLAQRRAALDSHGRFRGFFIAAPAREFIYYLLKCIDKQRIDDAHGSYLNAQWLEDREGGHEQVRRFWKSDADVAMLARAAESGEWGDVRRSLQRLRREMRKQLHFSWLATFREFHRRIVRLTEPTGLMVAFLGPDGSGKSSVIKNIMPVLHPAFRRVEMMHLRPRLETWAQSSAPVTTPQGKPARGWFGSMAKLLHLLADYSLGYLFKLRPMLIRSTLIIFDRHYQDLLVDPLRYRYGASLHFARWVGRFIPRPDLWLVLDAPVDVIQARKREVPPEESARQRETYLQLAARFYNAAVVDAAQTIDTVVAQSSNAILEHLAQRTAKRINAHLPPAVNPASTRTLLFFCRHHVPLLSRLMRVLFNSDIYAKLSRSVCLPHPYGIIIHSKAVIGERVTIMQQVTIGGKNMGKNIAPIIGDDVYIGAGAKILGGLHIGNGATIGANAVVTRDVPAHGTVVGANRLVPRESAEHYWPPPPGAGATTVVKRGRRIGVAP